MMSLLEKKLKNGAPILADGATGTNLFSMGLEAGEAPELWNKSQIDKVMALYSSAIDAGSDLFLTNSFGANRARLALHGAGLEAYDLSAKAAELARKATKKTNREIVIAGSVGPTGELMGEVGTLSHSDAVEIFYETGKGLREGGADVLWVETISSLEEFTAAVEAFESLKSPWCGTMSFDTAGRTMMGVTSKQFVSFLEGFSHAPLAIGANCGVGASDLLRTMLGMREAKTPLIAKGNAGIPKFVDGEIVYDGTPNLMADYVSLALRSGVRIIGGCCGTTAQHLMAMRKAMDEFSGGAQPELEEIAERLGAFSSKDDGTGAENRATKRSRTRRRG